MARGKFLFDSILLFLISLIVGQYVFLSETISVIKCSPFWWILFLSGGILTVLCFTLGVACIVISTQHTAEHYTVFTAFHHFIVKYHRLYVGARMLRRFRACCENPRKVQQELLLKIIKENKHTAYGSQFQLSNINCLEDLRRKHPVTDYNRYETFVDRIAKGEKNILTTEIVTRLILTSGTTGKGKLIPQDGYTADKQLTLHEALQQEMFPDLNPMQSKFRIHCNGQIRKSEYGITIAPALAVESHMLRYMVVYSSPPDSFMIDRVREATYVHLLFALRDRNLGSIFAPFSSLFLEVMKYLEANWQTLVDDLTRGTLNTDLELSPRIRSSLTKTLGAGDAQRATEVQRECEKGFDGILKRLWPHLKFTATIDNVNLRERLKNSFAKGLEIYSPLYVSSETTMGINLWPFEHGEEEYALYLTDNVFEFIHEDDMEKANPKTFFVDEVEVGQNYELIFTQMYGLYRYRLGDVVKVSGFYKKCPKVKFLYRNATLLNLVGEKVDQTIVSDSLTAALYRWSGDVELYNYSVAENTLIDELREEDAGSDKTNLFYVFFLELESKNGGDLPGDLQPEILAQEIDQNIYERHSFYRNYKDTNQISKSKVYFVNPGTFQKLREFLLTSTSASRSQFKMPLKLRTKKMAEIMLENIS